MTLRTGLKSISNKVSILKTIMSPLASNSCNGETVESNQLPVLLGHVEDDNIPFDAFEQKQMQGPNFVHSSYSMNLKLHCACANGDPVSTKSLLEAKVDANSKDYGGRTPLHVACGCKSAGAKEVVQFAVESWW